MLAVALLVSLSKVGLSLTSLALLVTSVAVLAGGGALAGRRVRREGGLQVASAATLGMSGVPLELASGVPWQSSLATALTWVVVFVAGALVVRAAFARKRAQKTPAGTVSAAQLETVAAVGSALAAIVCLVGAAYAEALALAFTTASVIAFSSLRFTPKQVRELGLLLAGMMVLVATTLIFGSQLLHDVVAA